MKKIKVIQNVILGFYTLLLSFRYIFIVRGIEELLYFGLFSISAFVFAILWVFSIRFEKLEIFSIIPSLGLLASAIVSFSIFEKGSSIALVIISSFLFVLADTINTISRITKITYVVDKEE